MSLIFLQNDFVFENAAIFGHYSSYTRCLCWSTQYNFSVTIPHNPQRVSDILFIYIYEFY